MNDEQMPYLAAALFCERILDEKDGVLSAIRIVDRVTITAPDGEPSATMPMTALSVRMLLIFVAGECSGARTVDVTWIRPNGTQTEMQELILLLEGEEHRVNLLGTLDIKTDVEGVHWFEVRIEGEVLTRVPLEVRYAPNAKQV